MRKMKYTLPFVNNGEAFIVPDWTVEKHERAISAAVEGTKKDKDLSDSKKENELKYYIILETLLELDATVSIEDVKNFFKHPENLVEFFQVVYYAGKKNIYFQEGGKKKTPKK